MLDLCFFLSQLCKMTAAWAPYFWKQKSYPPAAVKRDAHLGGSLVGMEAMECYTEDKLNCKTFIPLSKLSFQL